MAVSDQRQIGSDVGTLCRAEDLRGFLQQLSDQIADADRRHSESLRDMRERLARLGDQAGSIKQTMPKGFETDLERLEAGMVTLAQRMADAEQPGKDAHGEPGSDVFGQSPDSEAHPSQSSHENGPSAFSRADVRHSLVAPPPALKSAVSAANAAKPALNGSIASSFPRIEDDAQAFSSSLSAPSLSAPSLSTKHDDEPWDKQSADALARLYDSGEVGIPKLRHPLDLDLPPSVTAAAPTATAALLSSTAVGTVASLAPSFAAQPTGAAPVSGHSDADRAWFESRLGEIASRVELSLSELRPDNSMSDLGHRFDQLEERWNTAMADMATRSDVEGLRIVEAHIAELTTRLEQTQVQLARLDAIEAQLVDVAGQLTDDQIVRLFGGLVPTEEDLSRFAEAAAEKVATRMLSDMPAHSAPAHQASAQIVIPPALEANQLESNERIAQLQTMLSSFIDERRRGEVETSEALETMQHAMQHMLDRVDAFDGTKVPAPAAPATRSQLADVAHHLEQAVAPAHDRAPSMAEASGSQAMGNLAFEEAKAAVKAAAAAAGRGGQNAQLRSQFGAGGQQRIEPTMDTLRADVSLEDEMPSARNSRGAAATDATPRSAMEMARRAAGKARAVDTDEDNASKSKPGLRERMSIGAGGDKGEKGGVRPTLLLVPCVGALLLAGYWFLAGPKTRLISPASKMEQSSPAKTGKPATQKSGPVIEEEIDDAEKGPAKPSEGGKGAEPGQRTDGPKADIPLKRGASMPSDEQAAGQQQVSSVDGRVVAGTVTSGGLGIAVQQSRQNNQVDILRAREQMHIATLSQRTAQNAAQTSAVPPHAIPAALQQSDPAEPAAGNPGPSTQADGRTVLELPSALVGPLSLRLAAAKGDPSAQFEVASRFAEGKGVKQDFGQAAAWYQRAANQGLPAAQYRLAALFERGLGIKADPARARVWYKRAAEQGNVKAMHNLAVLSAGRDQGSADYPTAVQWFSEAAERGLSDSQYNLGVLYESGLGVPKDTIVAFKWYAIAARNGDKEASRRHEMLRAKLDAVALQAAEESVQSWRARPTESSANDAIAAGTAWKTRAAARE